MKWVYLYTAIVTEVIATSALKSSEGFSRLIPSIIVIVSYAVSFYFFALTLKTIPIGIGYAIWSGVGVVLITMIGVFFYHQRLDIAAIIGMTLIVAGVIIINLFSKSVID
jgi:small multidrug resistance pump